MILKRFYDDLLAQASYLLACESTGQALVVDPNRDIAQYLDAAAADSLTIVCVTETHIHADFVSGARDLAAAAGATLAVSAEGGPDWQYRTAGDSAAPQPRAVVPLAEGDELRAGTIRLDVLHTPGHTPEHLAFLVTDTSVSERPVGLLSGDFIFVGDVGRPDLLERAAHVAGTMESSARDLYRSLRRAAELPDYLQLWPGHGAGSACGKALGALPQSTLGYERIANPALRHADERAFVADILSAQPEPPRYFARMKRVNRDGLPPAPRGAPPRMTTDDVRRAIADRTLVVDTRPSAAFVHRFVPGTLCVPKSKSFLAYFGAVAPEECPVVLLVSSPDDVPVLTRWLGLIGFDRVTGWALAGDVIDAVAKSGETLATMRTTDVHEMQARISASTPPLVLDVRGAGERALGQVPGATGVALGGLDEWAQRTAPGTPLLLHCQTGTRAVIGASVLVARGFHDVTSVIGGFEAWTSAGFPVDTSSPQ
ncbi:MAG TPA: MBL fold metallo-hydrolase [Gemmatimonadaceae bacterium]|nr:MBL fold metallo-hydrolase [Gemmatimonadaceae bacterium]